MAHSIDERLIRIAAKQHGVVKRTQALGAGLTSRAVETLLANGVLRRAHAGIYVLGHLQGRLEPRRTRVMAAVLACGRGALLSHWHAAELLELLPKPAAEQPVNVRVPPGRVPARRIGIRVHMSSALPPRDRDVVDGVPVTSPLRTLADLATVADHRALERAIARAERNGLVTMEALRDLTERRRGRPGGPLLLAVLGQDGGPAAPRSELEERFQDLLAGTGLSRPRVNSVVHGREVDCYWPAEGLVVELDGFKWHRSRGSVRNDRDRDGELVARGLRVLRFTWEHVVEEPKATLATLIRALAVSSNAGRGG